MKRETSVLSFTFTLLWLLPVTVSSGVLRELEDYTDDPCRVYNMDNLIHLDCSYRGLSELPDGLDYNAQVLILSNNNFVDFPDGLEKFNNVQSLDLSGNLLTTPLPRYFQNWADLKILNLSNNNYISWLSSNHIFTIVRLDLSKNKINNIEGDAFAKMPRLVFLELSENRIDNLPNGIFSKATRLEIVILSRNYFSELPRFESVSLRNLHVSSCQITTLDVNALSEMRSLLELDLSINQLESIPDNLASNSLQELDLSYNGIDTLTDLTFSSLPHLAVLDLRGNEFKEVWSTSHFASNPFLRTVHVKGNRWSCEGFSVNLLLTYEFLTKEPPKVYDIGSLICYSPSNVTQMSWQQAYIRTWHADEQSPSTYTFIAVMIGMIMGVIITSFVCRFVMSFNKPDPPTSIPETTALNGTTNQPRSESVVMRVQLREDLPPTYDEALLLPRLNASFHSLPDFIEEEEVAENRVQRQRRSRSIGDLTDTRHRIDDRRSVRRAVDINFD
ncbi:leucine-rich transmembrane protein [Danaus plexippus plexippus]|uniref:Leucine-rich transmembrane protein n=1 Tax=Danaus plexippus plexippus TaxID=278856 RepID=A0A212FID3_DANPL|nr:leucine-rich transmembrane protein [Danaus plexippus plexippus]